MLLAQWPGGSGFCQPKNFIGLYILRTDVMNAHRDLLKGKGEFR